MSAAAWLEMQHSTYRMTASSPQAAEFRACQMAGDHYPEYTDIQAKRMEVESQ